MKYKNIKSAIHNFGHSFISDMNYIDGHFIIHDLSKIHHKSVDITIDWLTGEFEPSKMATERIVKSIDCYRSTLKTQLKSQNVELSKLNYLIFLWVANFQKHIIATDDRGKSYKIEITKTM